MFLFWRIQALQVKNKKKIISTIKTVRHKYMLPTFVNAIANLFTTIMQLYLISMLLYFWNWIVLLFQLPQQQQEEEEEEKEQQLEEEQQPSLMEATKSPDLPSRPSSPIAKALDEVESQAS